MPSPGRAREANIMSRRGTTMQLFKSTLLLLIVCSSASDTLAAPDKIRVGVSLPLSGDASAFGNDIKDALLFADRIYGKDRVEFVFEDDKCSGKDATIVAQKFVSVDKVKLVTGFGCSEALLAAAPIYERTKTLVVSAGTAAPSISEAGDYIFRTYPSDVVPTNLLAKFVNGKHRKFAILVEDTSYPNGFADAFSAQDEVKGIPVQRESYPPGTTDFRSLLTRLRSQGVDGLLIVATTDRGLVAAVKQVRELNWNLPLYSSYLAGSPTFLSQAGKFADGIVFPDFPSVDNLLSEENNRKYLEFRKEFGAARTSDFYFITASSAIVAIENALDAADPKASLYSSRFTGPSGTFAFDKNGDVLGIAQVMRTVRDGKVVDIK